MPAPSRYTAARMLGVASKKMAVKPPQRADQLGELVLLDDQGAQVQLKELWRDHVAALVWLRHYG